MDADKWATEVAESYFGECIGAGELMVDGKRDRWVHETLDGAGFGDLDDGALIEMADKGLQSHGSFEISGNNTVRGALNELAFYGLESEVHAKINELVDEHDLDICDAISDSPPEGESEGYEGDSHIDELMVWRRPWVVWKHVEELGLWADFTTICPPTAIDRLRDAVENG